MYNVDPLELYVAIQDGEADPPELVAIPSEKPANDG
jgi:hypothetical protein